MSDSDEITCLKALLEESRRSIKQLRIEIAELKLVLHNQGIAVEHLQQYRRPASAAASLFKLAAE